jgi:hypothetical protein
MLRQRLQTGGSIDVVPYEQVGPAAQTYGYGFGVVLMDQLLAEQNGVTQ